MELYPLKLKAALKDYIWGGTRLRDEYGKKSDMDKVSESWELSCHKDGLSIITNGEFAGITLQEYIDRVGKRVLGQKAKKFEYFPILIKFIDAKDDLSIQVHPDNEYALRVEGEYGKTEMWYVVDAEEGASLVYGFKTPISKEEFAEHIENHSLLDVCNTVPVKKGDVFFIDAGTLHAIGKGCLICEIQQNSNTTYRVYDYGRLGVDGKPRQLHVDKALDVTSLVPPTRDTKPLAHISLPETAEYDMDLLAECEYFTVYHLNIKGSCELSTGQDSFHSITDLEGDLRLMSPAGSVDLKKGDTVFLPADIGDYVITGKGEAILSKI